MQLANRVPKENTQFFGTLRKWICNRFEKFSVMHYRLVLSSDNLRTIVPYPSGAGLLSYSVTFQTKHKNWNINSTAVFIHVWYFLLWKSWKCNSIFFLLMF